MAEEAAISVDAVGTAAPVPATGKGWLPLSNQWAAVDSRGGHAPSPRSLHVSVTYGGSLFVFGGYDGGVRVNDLLRFDFESEEWSLVEAAGRLPSPRDRHSAVVIGDDLYVFGGYDGRNKVNDMFVFNFQLDMWDAAEVFGEERPSPRHSHTAVAHESSLYIFGGYDGSYRADFYCYSTETCRWTAVLAGGHPPPPRYRSTAVTAGNEMYLFGGHDGTRHLQDVHVFDFLTSTWSLVETSGISPIPRDSHVAVVHGGNMFVFGGSAGGPLNDLHCLRLDSHAWSPVYSCGVPPCPRFCHSAAMHDSALYIFGGYDGTKRLSDLQRFYFGPSSAVAVPPSSLVSDLRALVNSDVLSDVTFIVEDRPVYAHRVLCLRCSYFRALLTGEMMEARTRELPVPDMLHATFLMVLEYLYTDCVDLPTALPEQLQLFEAADKLGIDRLKMICEGGIMSRVSVQSVAHIFQAADLHSAAALRGHCLAYMVRHFDEVTHTAAFEEMGRSNVDLVFEVLRSR